MDSQITTVSVTDGGFSPAIILKPTALLSVTDDGKIMQAWQCVNTGLVEWRELERYEDVRERQFDKTWI
jgi:hypothetical protein